MLGCDVGECDIRSDGDVDRLFERHRFSTVVHLGALLPTAFLADPLAGADVNLAGTVRVLKAVMRSGVQRFVFGSSASVYGSSARPACSEDAAVMPDEPYGAAKLAIERILEALPLETVSLRIARVLGPGVRSSHSIWRSRIFEHPDETSNELTIPFAPDAILSVVHVSDVAAMLQILAEAERLPHSAYNTPVELLRTSDIKHMVERERGWHVLLGTSGGGPQIEGDRFVRDFRFTRRPLPEHLRL